MYSTRQNMNIALMLLFWAPEMFTRDAYDRPRPYGKPASQTGARKWSRLMAPVSGACVMGANRSFRQVWDIPLFRYAQLYVYKPPDTHTTNARART